MTRVFHVLTEAEPFSESCGGAISRWAANVTRTDKDAVVCAPWADDSWGFDAARLRNVPGLVRYNVVNDWMTSRIPWPLRKRMLVAAFGGVLRELKAGDTVWIHNRPEYAAALSRHVHERGASVVLHMHNSHLAQWVLRGHAMPRADRYVFVSRFLETEARESGAKLEGAEILYNGADDGIFYPAEEYAAPRTTPVVLFAGRLVPEKGVHIFLEAMAGLGRAGIALQGVVMGGAGFGDRKSSEYVKRLHATTPPNVAFEKYRSGKELGDRFREADIFCLPSCWHDPFPLAVLEAMACRLPVMTTRSGGIPEALSEGGGVMVERNNVFELQTALMQLAADADKRKELASQGYASFQRNFTWQSVREQYRGILMRLRADGPTNGSTKGSTNGSKIGPVEVSAERQNGEAHAACD